MITIKIAVATTVLGTLGSATGALSMLTQDQPVLGEGTLVPFGIVVGSLLFALTAGRWIERVVQLQKSNAHRIARIEIKLGIAEDGDG